MPLEMEEGERRRGGESTALSRFKSYAGSFRVKLSQRDRRTIQELESDERYTHVVKRLLNYFGLAYYQSKLKACTHKLIIKAWSILYKIYTCQEDKCMIL